MRLGVNTGGLVFKQINWLDEIEFVGSKKENKLDVLRAVTSLIGQSHSEVPAQSAKCIE